MSVPLNNNDKYAATQVETCKSKSVTPTTSAYLLAYEHHTERFIRVHFPLLLLLYYCSFGGAVVVDFQTTYFRYSSILES